MLACCCCPSVGLSVCCLSDLLVGQLRGFSQSVSLVGQSSVSGLVTSSSSSLPQIPTCTLSIRLRLKQAIPLGLSVDCPTLLVFH